MHSAANSPSPRANSRAREMKQLDDRKRARAGSRAARRNRAPLAAASCARRFERELSEQARRRHRRSRPRSRSSTRCRAGSGSRRCCSKARKQKLLGELGAKHEVQLFDLDGGEAQKIWQPTAQGFHAARRAAQARRRTSPISPPALKSRARAAGQTGSAARSSSSATASTTKASRRSKCAKILARPRAAASSPSASAARRGRAILR